MTIKDIPNSKDKELKLVFESNAPNGPMTGKVLISFHDDEPLILMASVIGQVIGDVYADPTTVFFGLVQQENTVTKRVQLRGRKNSITIIRLEVSKSIERIITVDVTEDSLEPALRVSLSVPKLPKGQKSEKRIDGFIRLVVGIDEAKNDKNTLTNKEMDSIVSDNNICTVVHESLNIPVLAFITTNSQNIVNTK